MCVCCWCQRRCNIKMLSLVSEIALGFLIRLWTTRRYVVWSQASVLLCEWYGEQRDAPQTRADWLRHGSIARRFVIGESVYEKAHDRNSVSEPRHNTHCIRNYTKKCIFIMRVIVQSTSSSKRSLFGVWSHFVDGRCLFDSNHRLLMCDMGWTNVIVSA